MQSESRAGLGEKEDVLNTRENRLGEKEQYLDKRQMDIDREAERIKGQIDEDRAIKVKADALIVERQKAVTS